MRYDERKEVEAFERGLNVGRLDAAKDLAAAEERVMGGLTKPGIYRHYKGGLYRVLFTALESTNGRGRVPLVVYVSLGNGTANVREEIEFHEVVIADAHSGPVPRFAYVGESL